MIKKYNFIGENINSGNIEEFSVMAVSQADAIKEVEKDMNYINYEFINSQYFYKILSEDEFEEYYDLYRGHHLEAEEEKSMLEELKSLNKYNVKLYDNDEFSESNLQVINFDLVEKSIYEIVNSLNDNHLLDYPIRIISYSDNSGLYVTLNSWYDSTANLCLDRDKMSIDLFGDCCGGCWSYGNLEFKSGSCESYATYLAILIINYVIDKAELNKGIIFKVVKGEKDELI